jgi:UDP-N-acetylmuramate dehydrogenase
VIDFCVVHGVAGLERFAGLPGTVAGAVVDPGVAGPAFPPLVAAVELLRAGEPGTIRCPASAARRGEVVVSVTLRLRRGRTADLLRVRRNVLLERNAERPLNMPGGTGFRDPAGGKAVELLRAAGCAGMRAGGALASERYPNCIVAAGGARADDVLALLRKMRDAVRDRMGVVLTLQARTAGFDGEPLKEVA